jgi:hypothetical protein
MNGNVYLYILVMAGVTYLIRLIPLVLMRKEIRKSMSNRFFTMCVCNLSGYDISFHIGGNSKRMVCFGRFITALILAYRGCSLFKVSVLACLSFHD